MKPGIHVSDWGVALDAEDIKFVADALKFISTYDGCEKPVQKRAATLAKTFRSLAKKKKQ